MTFLSRFICVKCKEIIAESKSLLDLDPVCSSCKYKEAEVKKKEHLDELQSLSLEERLARIEKTLYEWEDDLKKT